jgi:hypothetical protein
MHTFTGRVELLAAGQVIGAGQARLYHTPSDPGGSTWRGEIRLAAASTPPRWPQRAVRVRLVSSGANAIAHITLLWCGNTGPAIEVVGTGDPPPF